MLSTTLKKSIATALSGAAIAGTIGASAASAMPIDPLGAPGEPYSSWPADPTPRASGPDRDGRASAPVPVSAPVETAPDVGFDLSSAAIGAAAGTGLLIVVLAAGGLAWRRPMTREHSVAGA